MFFKRKPEPEPDKRQDKEPAELLLPVQSPDQSDEDHRQVLIELIDEIDETKRDIKAQIHSHAIRAKAERTSVNQVWLRRAKDKMDHLTREREEVRKALHTVNERIKSRRRDESRPKPGGNIHKEFVRIARERLPSEEYESIMNEAEKALLNRNRE